MKAHSSLLLLIPATLLCAFALLVSRASALNIYDQPSGSYIATSSLMTAIASSPARSQTFIANDNYHLLGGAVHLFLDLASSEGFYVCVVPHGVNTYIVCTASLAGTGHMTEFNLTLSSPATTGDLVYGTVYEVAIVSTLNTPSVQYPVNSNAEMLVTVADSGGLTVSPNWGGITYAPGVDFGPLSFIASSTALYSDANASSSLAAIASQCSETGNIFGRAICWAGAYLFIPNPTVLNNYASLPTLMSTKFPFSWLVAVKTAITALSAGGGTTQEYTFNLHDLGLGSTTPLGNVLPNYTGFSSSTVFTYISPTIWAAGQALIAAALWLALGFDIYVTVRRRHAHV